MAATFAIGIDLGTTNTALGAVRIDDDKAVPIVFGLTQVTAPHETMARPLLPSFVYQPASSELPDCVGEELAVARRRRPPRSDPALWRLRR